MEFNNEHLKLLKEITNEPLEILHEIKINVFKIDDIQVNITIDFPIYFW